MGYDLREFGFNVLCQAISDKYPHKGRDVPVENGYISFSGLAKQWTENKVPIVIECCTVGWINEVEHRIINGTNPGEVHEVERSVVEVLKCHDVGIPDDIHEGPFLGVLCGSTLILAKLFTG